MIKKTITIASMLILSAALMFAVWEGNAAAGSQEAFPSGLFAASDLFPKYTFIEITNLEENTTSRAVVIGNMVSDGLLVTVSPDLAKALSIKEGGTVRVRVSVPPLVAEEGADPVLLGKVEKKHPVPAAPVKPADTKPQVIQAEKPMQKTDSTKDSYETPIQNEPAPPEVSEPVLPKPEPVPVPSAVSEVTEPVGLLVQSEYSAETEKPVPGVASVQEPQTQEDIDSSGEYAKPVQEVTETNISEKIALNDVQEPVPEVSTPIAPESETVDEDEPVKDIEKPVEEPAPVAVEPNEEQAEEAEELQDEPEIVISQEIPVEKKPEDTATKEDPGEQHAMLVPTEPRVPVREELPAPKEPEKPAVPDEPVVTQPAEELYTAHVLTKGSFYVQIGRFKDMLNVDSFVQLYGKQYPIAIEKSSTAKDVFYKVYVGPLQKDERGAALETFQKLGFKDAFLKKAP